MKFNKLKFSALTLAMGSFALIITSCSQPGGTPAEAEQKTAAPSKEEMIAKGEYLVGIMGCND